jgi:hypothetical protein
MGKSARILCDEIHQLTTRGADVEAVIAVLLHEADATPGLPYAASGLAHDRALTEARWRRTAGVLGLALGSGLFRVSPSAISLAMEEREL